MKFKFFFSIILITQIISCSGNKWTNRYINGEILPLGHLKDLEGTLICGKLEGFVKYSSGKAYNQEFITIQELFGKSRNYFVYSDSKGYFFRKLNPGEYKIRSISLFNPLKDPNMIYKFILQENKINYIGDIKYNIESYSSESSTTYNGTIDVNDSFNMFINEIPVSLRVKERIINNTSKIYSTK